MGNSTNDSTPKVIQDQLQRLLDAYRGQLRADERRLHEAMLEYEQSCWVKRLRRAA